MSDCSRCDEWLDGGLDQAERAAFERHLPRCERCARKVAHWRALGGALRQASAPDHEPPPGAQVTRLLARAGAARAEPGRGRLRVPALVVVGALAAVALVLLVRGRLLAEEALGVTLLASTQASVDGGTVETGAGGRAVFTLGRDTVGVGAGTRLRVLHAGTRSTTLVLERGTAALRVEHDRGARDVWVRTPLAEVHVVGTVFRARVSLARLEVDVLEGTVEVRPRGRPGRKVTAASALVVTPEADELRPLEVAWFDELDATPAVEPGPEAPDAGPRPDAGPEAPDAGPPPPRAGLRGPAPSQAAQAAAWRGRATAGDCAGVVQEISRYAQRTSLQSETALLWGDCLRRLGRASAAVEAYEQAARGKEPGANRARLLAAAVLQDDLGQPARAIALLDAYLKRGAELPALEAAARVRKARAQRALGQEAAARAGLEDVIRRFPDTPAAGEAQALLRSPP